MADGTITEEKLTAMGLNTLTEDQKRNICTLVGEAAKASRRLPDETGILVAGSRKPDIYNPETTEFTSFLSSFDNYRQILGIQGMMAIRTFFTYLKTEQKLWIEEAGHDNVKEWDTFITAVTQLFEKRVQQKRNLAKTKLKTAKQLPTEDILKFGDRLLKLSRKAYPGYLPAQKLIRDHALKEALTTGIRKDEIAVPLIATADTKTFNELVSEAASLETSYQVRAESSDNSDVHVNILKASNSSGPPIQQQQQPLFQQAQKPFL